MDFLPTLSTTERYHNFARLAMGDLARTGAVDPAFAQVVYDLAVAVATDSINIHDLSYRTSALIVAAEMSAFIPE